MSVSGPSPLGTLMVQRVEAALGTTLSQQANLATGARPDAVTQPGQPDKVDPTKNPPPKEQEGRQVADRGGRQGTLAALARNDPELAKLLAARNAPMTSYTASAPTTLGQAAKAILALLQQFPDARPTVVGRAPLFSEAPGKGPFGMAGRAATGGGPSATGLHGTTTGTGSGASAAGAGSAGSTGGGAAAGAAAGQAGTTGQPASVAVAGQGGESAAAAQMGARGQGAVAGQAAGASNPAASQSGSTSAAATTSATQGSAATGASAAAGPASAAAAPAGMGGPLASALAHALQNSGLFYESHLRDFAFGRRTLMQMQAEPQAQLGSEGARGTAAQSGGQATGDTASSTTAQSAQSGQTASSSAQAQFSSPGAQLANALLGLDPSTQLLVRQQLEALATQSVGWRGEAWPGSDLDLEIQRRDGDATPGGETDAWATRLKLTLPTLGEVEARLSFTGSRLVMHLVAPQSAEMMGEHTNQLRKQLHRQGLQLDQVTVSRDSRTASQSMHALDSQRGQPLDDAPPTPASPGAT